MSNSFNASFEVTVDSLYGERSDYPGEDQHNVSVTLGGVPVYSQTFTEAPDRHHGDENWDPVAYFGEAGLAAFAHVLSKVVDSVENGG